MKNNIDLNILEKDLYLGGLKQLKKFIEKYKTDSYLPLPSEWAEDSRYIPPGLTNYPGKIDHTIAPHLIRIQDLFHPDNPARQITIMKGTQALVTTTLENVIGWSIEYKLHNILYIISSKHMAAIRSSMAIDVLIDNSGLKEYIKPISDRVKRKTGDKTFYKELHGGLRLMMTSWHSIGDAKSLSWDLIIMDELEEAPYELAGQGDPEKIFGGRAVTAGRKLKIAKISTPTNTHGRIAKNFYEGNQEYFFAQCPLCGERQVLDLYGMGNKYGLRARSEKVDDYDMIIPESVEYICKHCQGSNKEIVKSEMLKGGVWQPTAKAINPTYISMHVSNLMSPIMFYSWSQAMQAFCETKWGQEVTKFKNFKIDILGLPWEIREDKTDYKLIQARTEDYQLGEIPLGALFLTAGLDVQKNWLAYHAIGWGKELESWVIDYKIFFGETKNIKNDCWKSVAEYYLNTKYKTIGRQKEILLPVSGIAVDSAFNPGSGEIDNIIDSREHVVYEFVSRLPRAIAARGEPKLKEIILKEAKVYKSSHLTSRYDFNVNDLKEDFYRRLNFMHGQPGAIHFPQGLDSDYFKGITSEIYTEIEPGKFGWKKVFARNEPLDTFNLARAKAEHFNLSSWPIGAWNAYEKKIFG